MLAVEVIAEPDLETVSSVDLDRYQGVWHEIARLPNRFQDHCAGDVTATYRELENGVEVINRCREQGGDWDQATGFARVVDASTNAKLEVSFVSLFGWHLFWGDYWVVALDTDYQWVIVGEPSRKYGWILARSPEISSDLRQQLNLRLKAAGYEPSQFISSPQAP